MSSTRRSGLASLIVSVAGLAVSAYLTAEHFSSGVTLACPESATINCQKVTTSTWARSRWPCSGCCSSPAWPRCASRRSGSGALDPVRVTGAPLGVLSAVALVWIELFRINAICLWCTGVHVCALVPLGTVLWTTSTVRADYAAQSRINLV